MIGPELEAEILRLFHAEKWKVGTIAAQLHLHHSTVRRVLAQAAPYAGRGSLRPSIADPFIPFIVETLEKYPRLRASRLYVMARERGYQGGPDHFRAVVARFRPRPPAEAYLRLRTLPGEQAQVDWGHFGKLTVGRAERALMAFVLVLSWSRWIFLRFFLGAAMANFLRGHVEAFTALGSLPRVVLYDNLKSAVTERVGDAIRFHPMLLSLAAHYRFGPRPVAPARGNEQALVADKREARRHRGLDRLQRAVPSTERLFLVLAERGANLGSATSRLLRLLDAHAAQALEEAVREALDRDVPHVAAIRHILDRKRHERGQPPPLAVALSDDPRVRDLTVRPHSLDDYEALHKESQDDDEPEPEPQA